MPDMRVPNGIDPAESALSFFASELRRLRDAAGLTQAELAAEIYCTRSLVSLTEIALRRPTEEFATLADKALNGGGTLTRLWPLVNRSAYPGWFRSFVDLERAATVIRSYQLAVVDGLLQTEEYARSVLSILPHKDLDDLVTARMSRQEILSREDPPFLSVVLHEVALRCPVGGPELMRRQLHHLEELSRRPGVLLRVLPIGQCR